MQEATKIVNKTRTSFEFATFRVTAFSKRFTSPVNFLGATMKNMLMLRFMLNKKQYSETGS